MGKKNRFIGHSIS